MNLRVLAIVAHPADAFDMIGGTLANHLEDNDEVTLVILQSNDLSNLFSLADAQHGGQLTAGAIQQALENHRASTKAACGILGIEDVRFLEFPDEWITYSPKLVAGIADLIQEVRPHLLLTHHPMEDGGACEHGTCGKAVIEATYLADGARKSGLAPHHTGQIYFFCPTGTTNLLDATTAFRYPGIMVDVTRQIEKKVKAYAQLSAQYITLERSAKIMEGICGQPGIHVRAAYVETFLAYRPEVYQQLPISDHNKKLSEGTWKEGLEHLKLLAPFVEGVRPE